MTGEELKRWRQSKDKTRAEFGEDCGVSEHTVAKWEQGVNPIPKIVQKFILSPPQLPFTIEQFRKLLRESERTGRSIEEVSLRFIAEGLEGIPSK